MINVFTDGSANNMIKKIGGIGVFFSDPLLQKYNISKKIIIENCTNQKMELIACIEAIEAVISFFNINEKHVWDLTIHTDSQYTIDCINKYAPIWIKKGWKKQDNGIIQNLDEIKKLYMLSVCYKINYNHVKSHIKEPKDKKSQKWNLWYGNKMADKLANLARI